MQYRLIDCKVVVELEIHDEHNENLILDRVRVHVLLCLFIWENNIFFNN